MKKFITAAAISILSGTVAAQAQYDAEYNMVTTIANERNDFAYYIDVDPVNNCEPVFVLAGTGANPNESIQYKARIDRKGAWDITGTVRVSDNRQATFISTDAPPQLISELRRGHTLRLKLPMMNAPAVYLSFSLQGFSRAYGKAKAACIKPEQYFNEPTTSNNAEYFL